MLYGGVAIVSCPYFLGENMLTILMFATIGQCAGGTCQQQSFTPFTQFSYPQQQQFTQFSYPQQQFSYTQQQVTQVAQVERNYATHVCSDGVLRMQSSCPACLTHVCSDGVLRMDKSCPACQKPKTHQCNCKNCPTNKS